MRPASIAMPSLLLLWSACARPPPVSIPLPRAQRLLALAVGEAALIGAEEERLRHLLNVAYRQNLRGYRMDARASLSAARRTLLEAQRLGDHPRLAAWVSISQLSRSAGDFASARSASEEAVRFLKRLEPIRERTQYVRGVATELRALMGNRAAVAILREAASWAEKIQEATPRREALASIAWDLFLCDDYEGGLAVLRREPDAAWRADRLTRLAAGGFAGRAATRYGKALDFESYYIRR